MITKAYILDLAERAVSTFVQAFAGFVATAYLAGAVTDLADVSAWKKLAGAGIAAGLAAVASLIKGVLAGLKTGTASASAVVAATAVEQPGGEPPVVIEPPVNVTSSDPGQHEA